MHSVCRECNDMMTACLELETDVYTIEGSSRSKIAQYPADHGRPAVLAIAKQSAKHT